MCSDYVMGTHKLHQRSGHRKRELVAQVPNTWCVIVGDSADAIVYVIN